MAADAGGRAARGGLSRSARAAAGTLFGFATLAVWAPFVASDLPITMEAVDVRAFERARASLEPVARNLVRECADAQAPHARRQGEVEALALRARTLREALLEPPPELAGVERSIERVDAALAAGSVADRTALAREVESAATALAASLAARGLAAPGGERWRMRRSWPLLAALSALDLAALGAWGALVTGWLWARVRSDAKSRLSVLALWTLAWTAAGAALPLFGHAQAAGRGGASIKQGLSSGGIRARTVHLPLLFYGPAETHSEEGNAPPSWLARRRSDESADAPGAVPGGATSDEAASNGLRAAPRAPVEVRFGEPAADSPWRHLAGTDALGRDVLARLVWGGRASLAVGLLSALALGALGVVAGALAGYFGGRTDFAISRTIEVVLAIPPLYLIVLAAAWVDPRALDPVLAVALIIAAVAWTGVARLVRARLLELRSAPHVVAARALGLSPARVLFVHALPGALTPAIVAVCFAVGAGILTESVVSYLGFGVQPPTPSWGSLIAESRSAAHWWLQVLPGLCILAVVASANGLGEALRSALDPRAEGPRP